MGRSFFIINSGKPGAEKPQLRRFRDEFRSAALCTEGPFADRKGSLRDLEMHVRRLIGPLRPPVTAAIDAIAPQNMEVRELSLLPVPFIMSESYNDRNVVRDCAGAITSSDPIMLQGSKWREADPEHLDLVGVAVLRRLGIESFFAMAHLHSQEPSTCILVTEGAPRICSTRPPFEIGRLSDPHIAAVEVLDQDALLSLVKMKVAASAAEELMRDVAARNPLFDGEGTLRAAAIGHTLHKAVSLWPIDEARKCVDEFISCPDMPSPHIRTVREIMERLCVQPITSLGQHEALATEIIAEEILLNALGRPIGACSPHDAAEALTRCGMQARLSSYMTLATVMNEHMHHASECRDLKVDA